MLDHLGINCADAEASAHFYDEVLAVLGHRRFLEYGSHIGYGTDMPAFWISPREEGEGPPAEDRRGVHIAFTASDAATVREFFAKAVELGAEVIQEPRLCPEYHPGYYGAFVRDPDGHNVEACCHTAGPED